jgi:hypothetical protein
VLHQSVLAVGIAALVVAAMCNVTAELSTGYIPAPPAQLAAPAADYSARSGRMTQAVLAVRVDSTTGVIRTAVVTVGDSARHEPSPILAEPTAPDRLWAGRASWTES